MSFRRHNWKPTNQEKKTSLAESRNRRTGMATHKMRWESDEKGGERRAAGGECHQIESGCTRTVSLRRERTRVADGFDADAVSCSTSL